MCAGEGGGGEANALPPPPLPHPPLLLRYLPLIPLSARPLLSLYYLYLLPFLNAFYLFDDFFFSLLP